MNTYDEFNDWISSTIRNEMYFSQHSATDKAISAMTEQLRQYGLAYRFLASQLSASPEKFTKKDYQVWVKAWKALYSKLSYESRMSKQRRKGDTPSARQNILNVYTLRIHASRLLELRKSSKELAEQAYLTRKALVSEAA